MCYALSPGDGAMGCVEKFEGGDIISEKLTRFSASRWGIIVAGAAIGLLAPLLQKLGYPPKSIS
jgi:hypothetical protein